MITSQRAELSSEINAYYATWTRLGLNAATSPAASRLRESVYRDAGCVRPLTLLLNIQIRGTKMSLETAASMKVDAISYRARCTEVGV